MSHRALRRMRQEREPQFLVTGGEEDESDDSSDDEGVAASAAPVPTTSNAFAMMNDSSSSDDDDDDDGDDEEKEEDSSSSRDDGDDAPGKEKVVPVATKPTANDKTSDDEVDDLDALLQEYKLKDKQVDDGIHTDHSASSSSSDYYGIITAGMDPRDLDIDHVMRTSLIGSSNEAATSSKSRSSRRGNRQVALFGPPKDEWPRPPHYVGGGMGMVSYDDWNQDESNEPLDVPWPYSDMKDNDERCPPTTQWYKFNFSDSYQRDLYDFETIQASGDANALAMFVAHHPFIVQALLQLSEVLYQTRQNQEGLAMLKRSLYVLECAALNSFLKVDGQRNAFMEYDLLENQPFFDALARLMRVSYVGGLARTAFAASRLLLSLDPLLDPKNVLLCLDHFALACNTENCDEWLVKFVESNKVHVFYNDEEGTDDDFECTLQDMPNWSFSYALALFRIYQRDSSEDDSKDKADKAIQAALFKFPTVIGEILSKNEVNTNSRSFQTDWPSVMNFVNELVADFQSTASGNVTKARTFQAYEAVVRIFVQQNFNLWAPQPILKWVYDNLQSMRENITDLQRTPLPPAILRYARCDPSDFADKFQTMPAEANPLDASAVALALTIDTNRPRLIQRGPRVEPNRGTRGDGNEDAAELEVDAQVAQAASGQNAGSLPDAAETRRSPNTQHNENIMVQMEEEHHSSRSGTSGDEIVASSWEYLGEGGKHALFFFDEGTCLSLGRSNEWKGRLLRIPKIYLRAAGIMCGSSQTTADPFVGTTGNSSCVGASQETTSPQTDDPAIFYIQNVVAPYLHPFVDVPEAVPLSWSFLKILHQKALGSGRIPFARLPDWEQNDCDKAEIVEENEPMGMMIFDYRSTLSPDPSSPQHAQSYTIELKPKAGYLAFSPLIHPNHRIKYDQSRFRSLQQLQVHGHWMKGWAKGDKQACNEMSLYDPLDLFSGDKSRIKKAVGELWHVPQNNLRVWCEQWGEQKILLNGQCNESTTGDQSTLQEIIVETLRTDEAQDLLRRLLRWQKLDVLDVDGAVLVYQRLVDLCHSEEEAQELLDHVQQEDIFLSSDDQNIRSVIPPLELSPFRHDRMRVEEEDVLRKFCETISDFRDWFEDSASRGPRKGPSEIAYMDCTRNKLLNIIQNDLPMPACTFLLRNWLLSLMMCDCSIFVTLEQVSESDKSGLLRDDSVEHLASICDGGVTNTFVTTCMSLT